jgi:nucleotide-binding universal stress UspA family protein
MLVPLDGSELAEIVIPYAKELAGRLDLEITLLNVCEPHSTDSEFMSQSYIDRVAEMIKSHSRDVQIKTGLPEGGKPVEVTGKVVTGHPAEEIVNFADKNDIDLILLSSHGRSGIKRWLLGSVADRVLQASSIPVWLVRASMPEVIAHEEWHKRLMIVPLDGSKTAESALPHVEALAKQRGIAVVNVVLLRVCEKAFVTADYPKASMSLTWPEHVKSIREHFKQEAENYLLGVQKRLAGDGLNVRSEVLTGNPEDEIIEYARKHHPSLIVITSHGSSGVSRWVYGNIAGKVLHGASNPVFIVRVH